MNFVAPELHLHHSCWELLHWEQINRLTFVSVNPFVCRCFVTHVVGQVSLFGPRGNVGGQAEQGVVHGQAIVVNRWKRGGEKEKVIFHLIPQHFDVLKGDLRILSEELSVWAGELDTLLLRWDDGWLPGLLWSSKEGAGEGLSGIRSCKPSSNRKTNQIKIKLQLQL